MTTRMLAVISIHVQDIVTTYDLKNGIVAVFSVYVDGIGTSSNNQQKNFSNYLAHNKSPWSREDNHRRQKSPTQRMSHCFHNSPYYKVLWRWEKSCIKSGVFRKKQINLFSVRFLSPCHFQISENPRYVSNVWNIHPS